MVDLMAPSSRTTGTTIRRHDTSLAVPAADNNNENDAQRILHAMSDRLETGLNSAALRAIQDLLEAGCHPDAVVAVVMSLSQL